MNILIKQVIYGILLYLVLSTINGEKTTETNPDYDDYDDVDANSTANGTLQFIKDLTNVTKETGQSVKLRCEVKNTDANVSASKVKFEWRVNEAPLIPDKRITIKNYEKLDAQIFISRLKINKLDVLDTSWYQCIASNGKNRISSSAILRVSSTEKWGNSPSELPTYPVPSSVDVTTFVPHTSIVDGHEKTFHHVPNAHFPSSSGSSNPSTHHQHHQRNEDVTFTVPISPVLSEPSVAEPGGGVVFVNNENIVTYNTSETFCQLYVGNTCRHHLGGQYVFIQPPYTQKNIEEKLENAYRVVSHSNDLSKSCSVFALPSLCYSSFPICIDHVQINHYQEEKFSGTRVVNSENIKETYLNLRKNLPLKRICKEDCELLENELCRKEYAIAKRHPVIGQTLQLEECVNLPEKSDKYAQFCLPLGVARAQDVNKDETCYWEDGEQYRGIHDHSQSNAKCMKWSHQFQIELSDHHELSGHSYCRNPDGMEEKPFCFVNQNKREVCNIPKCANIIWIYISVAIIIFVIIITFAMMLICCRNRKKNAKRNLQNMNVPTADKNIYGNSNINSPMEMNSLLPTRMNNIPPATRNHGSGKNGFQNVPNYTYKEVSFVEELGEGAFGKVYKGELRTKTGKIFVAVKSLKENASAKTQADFQREIDLISELKHPNIICLLGVVIKQEPMCMLFEFMSEGDLHEFLINNSPNEGKSLSQNDFLHIAIQIALGMEYLSENHYVHRDLAARNCLVSKDLVVKISDFGLSRDMYSCDYYRVQSKSLLPVRWMPPESILYGKFTTESDVWSYGVVLWEIYSYGLQPYYGYNNQEVINMIRSRKLLPCPDFCPSYCYALMVECWAELAIRRPSFAELSHRLRVWKQNGSMNSGAYFKNDMVAPPTASHHHQHQGGGGGAHKQQNAGHFVGGGGGAHSSRSAGTNSTSDSHTVCPTFENVNDPSSTWERNLRAPPPPQQQQQLHESQSSLTSRTSSLGNRTQSTNLSNDPQLQQHQHSLVRNSKRPPPPGGSIDSKRNQKRNEMSASLERSAAGQQHPAAAAVKNTVVNSTGDNYETKLSY